MKLYLFIFLTNIYSHFVPNISIGALVIKALRKHTTAILDCHLMVSDPEKWLKDFADAGANHITFHIEAVRTNEEKEF